MRFPVFVVGMPRSGTTLVSALLDAHPDLAILPETHFYTRCRSRTGASDTARAAWSRLVQQPGFTDAGFTEEERERLRSKIESEVVEEASGVLEAVGTAYAERAGAAAWGEKTPDHVPHIDRLLREFPDAVCLGVVRDPRDVCLSLEGLPWNRDTLMESAWTWRTYQHLLQDRRMDCPGRVRTVRYEDVLEAPESVLASVLEWLGASASPDRIERMLAFSERAGGPSDVEREPWKGKVRRPIDASNREKWRTQMPPARRWVVQTITGSALTGFGYPAPPVEKNRAFWMDLAGLAVDSLRRVARRVGRRIAAGSRADGDYTPEWMRRDSGA